MLVLTLVEDVIVVEGRWLLRRTVAAAEDGLLWMPGAADKTVAAVGVGFRFLRAMKPAI